MPINRVMVKAHELSEELKRILAQAEECNRKAAEYVFRENNEDSGPDEIDLHGLYVKEAEWILKEEFIMPSRQINRI